MIASPLSGLVTALNNLPAGLARQLQAIADQGLVGGGCRSGRGGSRRRGHRRHFH